MKNISFCSNILVLAIIVFTPSQFHNDYTRMLDYTILILLLLNFIILRLRKYSFINTYFVISIVQVIYCLMTVTSHTESFFQQSRISNLFLKTEIFSKQALVFFEEIWLYSFLILLILEIRFIYLTIMNKNIPKWQYF